MPVLLRDNRIYTPALRDGAPTIGPLDGLTMVNAGGYFTEPIDVGTFTELLGFLYTTAQGGSSPTLDVNMQYGWLDSSNQYHWVDSGDAFAQITTTGNGVTAKKQFTSNFGKYIRFRLSIGGTGSPTYKVWLKIAVKS